MAAPERKGKETLYLVDIPPATEGGAVTTVRLFNQTSGSRSIEADEIELNTKDKTGSDYGAVTETVSIEGIITDGDTGVKYIKDAIRNKVLVTITEVTLRQENGAYPVEKGLYMLSSIELSYENEDYSTYSIEAALNGAIQTATIATIPDGAPDGEIS